LKAGSKSGSQVTLVFGSEALIKRAQIKKQRDALVSPEARPFDEARLAAGCDEIERVRGELATRAVCSKGRLVWVSQCERLRAADVDILKEAVASGAQANHLILEAGELRATSALLNWVKRVGKLFRCAPLTGGALIQWVRQCFQKEGIHVEPDVPLKLIDGLSGNMSEIDAAVSRLALFAKESKRVTTDEVERFIPADRNGDLFELTGAFARKDSSKALRLVHEMLRMGRRVPEIVGLLFWQLKQLATARRFRDLKAPAEELARKLGRHPYYAERLLREAAGFTTHELARDLECIVQTDLRTKSSGLDDRVALELLVLRLCGFEAGETQREAGFPA